MRAIDRYRNGGTPADTPEPTATHVRAVALLDELLSTMLGDNTTLNPMAKILQRMRPALLRDMTSVPEESLRTFLVDLGKRMMLAGDPTIAIVADNRYVTPDVPDYWQSPVTENDMVPSGLGQDSTPTT